MAHEGAVELDSAPDERHEPKEDGTGHPGLEPVEDEELARFEDEGGVER